MFYTCKSPTLGATTLDSVMLDSDIVDVPLRHIFERPKKLAAEVLRGGMFHMCFVESGALAWPNGLELCPDAMLIWAEQDSPKRGKRRRA